MLSSYLSSQCLLNLYRLERALVTGDIPRIRQFRKTVFHYGRAALKNSKRFAAERTKALRLMGDCLWLSGKQAQAFSGWQRSIREGEGLNARPELSRTYLEVGRRLADEKSRIRRLNGLRAEDYLEKAGRGFTELDMESEESELDLISSQGL
jgi:hypothetical protein